MFTQQERELLVRHRDLVSEKIEIHKRIVEIQNRLAEIRDTRRAWRPAVLSQKDARRTEQGQN